jgi:hypothetical protein
MHPGEGEELVESLQVHRHQCVCACDLRVLVLLQVEL